MQRQAFSNMLFFIVLDTSRGPKKCSSLSDKSQFWSI